MLHCCTELMHSLEPHQHRRVCAEIVLKMKFSLNSGVSPFVILLWVHSVGGHCVPLYILYILGLYIHIREIDILEIISDICRHYF